MRIYFGDSQSVFAVGCQRPFIQRRQFSYSLVLMPYAVRVSVFSVRARRFQSPETFLSTHQFPRLIDLFIHEQLSSLRRKCPFSGASSA